MSELPFIRAWILVSPMVLFLMQQLPFGFPFLPKMFSISSRMKELDLRYIHFPIKILYVLILNLLLLCQFVTLVNLRTFYFSGLCLCSHFLPLQWDVLTNGNAVQEVAHIANGSNPGNCISVLRVRNNQICFILISPEFFVII